MSAKVSFNRSWLFLFFKNLLKKTSTSATYMLKMASWLLMLKKKKKYPCDIASTTSCYLATLYSFIFSSLEDFLIIQKAHLDLSKGTPVCLTTPFGIHWVVECKITEYLQRLQVLVHHSSHVSSQKSSYIKATKCTEKLLGDINPIYL